jgi:hypothetical protein
LSPLVCRHDKHGISPYGFLGLTLDISINEISCLQFSRDNREIRHRNAMADFSFALLN